MSENGRQGTVPCLFFVMGTVLLTRSSTGKEAFGLWGSKEVEKSRYNVSTNKGYIEYLDYCRALGTFVVVMLHSGIDAVQHVGIDSNVYNR